MKQLIKLGMLSQLLISTPLFAIQPIDGFYAGVLGQISHGPSSDDVLFREDFQLFKGSVAYSPISGGAGFMLGYKYKHFRAEGEFVFNRISTGPVTIGSCTLESPNIVSPTGICPAVVYDGFKAKGLAYSGSSTAIYGLVNGIWDFFSYEGSSPTSPYVGLGIGMGQIKNGSSFINTNTEFSHGHVATSTGATIQAILGLSYYMDAFTWATMDYRYLTTKRKASLDPEVAGFTGANLPTKNYTLNTLNVTINFAFDKGGIG